MKHGTLTFFCGKMGAGKTTRSREIAHKRNAVLISEDEWLGALYPNSIASLEDYIRYTARLKPQMKTLVQSILAAGTDVVMDFPANTVTQRNWFKSIFEEIQAPHELVYIDLPDSACLQQVAKRRVEQPDRAATDIDAMFAQVTKHFVAPTPDEGFNIWEIAGNA